MKEEIKCFLVSMGIGFAIGAIVTAKNKNVAKTAIKAEEMIMEKMEQAKEGIENLKEKLQENLETKELEKDLAKDTIVKKKQSKTNKK